MLSEGSAVPSPEAVAPLFLQLFNLNTKRKKLEWPSIFVTIQILSYEFLGPIQLSEWGPPMDQVLYLLLKRTNQTFQVLYAGESERTEEADFFTKNEKFKCWIQNAGAENNLYLSIYPMWGSKPQERQRILKKIIDMFQPPCNNSNKESNQ